MGINFGSDWRIWIDYTRIDQYTLRTTLPSSDEQQYWGIDFGNTLHEYVHNLMMGGLRPKHEECKGCDCQHRTNKNESKGKEIERLRKS